MSRENTGALFIAAFVVLIFQYTLVGIVGELKSEPWPAFVFPGFKSVYTTGEGIELNDVRFELHDGNGAIETMSPNRFFSDLPRSQVSGFIRVHFSGEDEVSGLDSEVTKWLFSEAERMSGERPQQISVTGIRLHFPEPARSVEPDSVSERFRFTLNPEGE